MRVVIIAAVASGGCNQVYELERTRLRDAAPPVDAVPDAATCAGGATPLTLTAPMIADAVLIDPNGGVAQAFGRNPNIYLNYGTSIRSVGIWRFDLSTISILPSSWLGMRILLEWLPADDDCGPPSCNKCDAFEEAGVMELYPLRNDWDEQTTSWNDRADVAVAFAWSEPGAAGNDRGLFLARATHAPRQPIAFAIAADGIAIVEPWIDAMKQVSIVVVPKNNPTGGGARMIIPALPPRASCNPPSPPARIEIDACP